LQGVWKTTPKICGKQGKISARWLFGSDRLGVFHRSRRGCALPRSPFDFAQGRLSATVGPAESSGMQKAQMTGRDAQPRFIAQKPRDGEEVGCATKAQTG